MSNIISICIIMSLFFMIVATLILAFIQKNMKNLTKPFLFMSFCIMGWLLSETLFFGYTKTFGMKFFYNLKLPFVSLTSVSLIILVLSFYRLDKFINMQTIFALLVIPFITTILTITSEYHNLLRSSFDIISTNPTHIINQTRGLWFWVHSIYCYILMVVSLVIIFVQHKKLPSGYRLPSTILIMGIGISSITSILSVFSIIDFTVDVTMIGMSISMIFIYVAIAGNSTIDFLIIARNDIFNYLEEIVFILSNEGAIIDCNISAIKWKKSLGIDFKSIYISDVLEHLKGIGARISVNENYDSGTDIYLDHEGQHIFYNLKQRKITSLEGTELGIYATFMDVTLYRRLISDLEKSAGIDSLTGLQNRNVYEQQKLNLDREEFLPLSILIGDVNGLKKVNDTLGHQKGDVLLRAIAQKIHSHSPNYATLCRIGGDEFAILLPKTSNLEAKNISSDIKNALDEDDSYNFILSISIGIATKTNVYENLDSIIHEADTRMYAEKKIFHS